MTSEPRRESMISAVLRLPRTVWLIGLISLVNDSASEMVYPVIPLFLSSVLMAGPRALGLIEGLAEATSALLKLFSGVLVDRQGRARPWIVGGYSVAALGRPLIALVTSWPGLLAIRLADRVGKGLRSSPRDAMLAASAGTTHRGLAFGLHRAMDNAGAVLGPVAAWIFLSSGGTPRGLFAWSIVPGLVCVALALAIREPAVTASAPRAAFDWSLRNLGPRLRRYLAVVGLFTLGNSSNMFLLLRARELGVAEAHVPLLWAAVSLVAMTFSTPLSGLSDRLGRVRFLVAGYLAYATFYAALGSLTRGGPGLFALFGFYGLFMAATEGVEKAFVADLAPATLRGTAFGWFNLVSGFALLPASVVFGWLYQMASPRVAFGFSSGCALAAALLLVVWVGGERESAYMKTKA